MYRHRCVRVLDDEWSHLDSGVLGGEVQLEQKNTGTKTWSSSK